MHFLNDNDLDNEMKTKIREGEKDVILKGRVTKADVLEKENT